MLYEIMTWIRGLHFFPAYPLIVLFAGIIYGTTFAQRLPFLKNVLVILFLGIGCILLTLFHIMGFPMIPVLFVTVLLIFLAKIRLEYSRRRETRERTTAKEAR